MVNAAGIRNLLEVPTDDAEQPTALSCDRPRAALRQFQLEPLQECAYAFGDRYPAQCKCTIATPHRAAMREAQKVERLRFPHSTLRTVRCRVPTKLQQTRRACQRRRTFSKMKRRVSLSRERPCRYLEKVE